MGSMHGELAKRIGSTQLAIEFLEAGGSTPDFDTLRRIAAALGLRARGRVWKMEDATTVSTFQTRPTLPGSRH